MLSFASDVSWQTTSISITKFNWTTGSTIHYETIIYKAKINSKVTFKVLS